MKPKITQKKLKDYLQDKKNFNLGNEYGQSLIEKSVNKFGAGRSMLASADNVLIAGNQAHQKLAEAGIENVIEVETDGKTAVVVKRTDIKSGSKQFHEMALADNATAKANITFDEVLIEEVLTEEVMHDWGVGNPKAEEDDYEAPPLDEIKTDIEKGDLLEITNGKLTHRLLCGDATSESDIALLMNGQKADIAICDPPYGVNYDGGTKITAKLKGDHDCSLYEPSSKMVFLFSKDGAAYYLFHAGVKGFKAAAAAAAAAAGYEIRCELIWNKNHAQFGALSAQYKQKHEPFYYCHKKGKAPYWQGAKNEVTVWDFDRSNKNEFHPTQKPVALINRIVGNSSKEGDICIDFFGGSGSTLVACHQTNRNSYNCEIEPKYCQIILDRMVKLDETVKITKNGKPYKRCDIGDSPNGTHKPSSKGRARENVKETAQQA